MAKPPTHLVDLAHVHEKDLPHVVVSLQGNAVVSRYGDDSWDLSPYAAAKNYQRVRMVFTYKFKNGRRLTDPEYRTLLASVKRFLYTRWRAARGRQSGSVTVGTLLANWSQIRKLIAWMMEEGITSFSELTPERCVRFAAHLASNHLQDSTVAMVLSLITSYFELGPDLIDQMPQYPWLLESGGTTKLARAGSPMRLSSWKQVQTEVIPTRLMKILVGTALDYIENRSDTLLALRDQLSACETYRFEEAQRTHRERYPEGFASVCASEEKYIRLKAYHRHPTKEKRLLASHGYQGRKQASVELVHLRTACYVVCAAFSGMRDSELASLEVGCFIRNMGFDNETFYWLKGTTYKLMSEPAPAEWMVPQIVGKAVEVATRLGLPERAMIDSRLREMKRMAKDPKLDERSRSKLAMDIARVGGNRNALLLTYKRRGQVSALGRDNARAGLVAFARMAGLTVKQEDLDGVTNRDQVRLGETWPITSHQFRRTFAVYVARHILGDIRYLREHFKHWSLDMTLYYARYDSNADRSLIESVLTERDELQSLIIESWMHPHSNLSANSRPCTTCVTSAATSARACSFVGLATPGAWRAATAVEARDSMTLSDAQHAVKA
jgi:integrase